MPRIKNLNEYTEQYQLSLSSSTKDTYWKEIAKEYEWFDDDFSSIQSGDFNKNNIKWFDGGQLNITHNCLDRHLDKSGDKIAVIWEDNDPTKPSITYTYKQLHERVCQFANVLKDQDIKKGDVVCFYMSMVPELMIGALACARIGAIHSVVFGGFSANALAGRINDCKAKIVITNDEAYRGAKTIPLKATTDEALQACTTVKSVLNLKRTGNPVAMKEERDFWLNELLDNASCVCAAEPMDSEDPLFILYTSGSTGQPKGLQHTTAGYMIWAGETFKQVFQMEQNDIYWCTADIGWITGHSYITYGPLLNGSTTIMFEGIPTYPDAGRFWEICEKHKVTHFYTAPTAIRALQGQDISLVKKHDLSSLKVLGSVGEPINEEAWDWYHTNIGDGNCPIVDTWWQTETGGIMISPLAGITKCLPAHATFPLPGVDALLVDTNGKEVIGNPAEGNLCLKSSWPGMARTIYGDHQRYIDTYFSSYPGYYFTGDGAKRDPEGNYRITGRVDDVINVSGHRIGTAEVEEAINQHSKIIESAVVGFPHDIKGAGLYAFVIMSPGQEVSSKELIMEVNQLIVKMIGPIAKLEKLQIVPGLPKTRSGKIMRRILRKIGIGDLTNFGDISTLLNPEIVEQIVQNGKE